MVFRIGRDSVVCFECKKFMVDFERKTEWNLDNTHTDHWLCPECGHHVHIPETIEDLYIKYKKLYDKLQEVRDV